MIAGVVIEEVVKHCDDRGFLIEVFNGKRALKTAKQTNFSMTYPGIIKAFHWHKKQDDFWFLFSGMAQVVLHDRRQNSPSYGKTQVIYAGEERLATIFIPRGVAHGLRVLGSKPLTMLYHVNECYDPNEPDEQRINFDDPSIGFDWSTKNR